MLEAEEEDNGTLIDALKEWSKHEIVDGERVPKTHMEEIAEETFSTKAVSVGECMIDGVTVDLTGMGSKKQML
jgi:hypothetical protein